MSIALKEIYETEYWPELLPATDFYGQGDRAHLRRLSGIDERADGPCPNGQERIIVNFEL